MKNIVILLSFVLGSCVGVVDQVDSSKLNDSLGKAVDQLQEPEENLIVNEEESVNLPQTTDNPTNQNDRENNDTSQEILESTTASQTITGGRTLTFFLERNLITNDEIIIQTEPQAPDSTTGTTKNFPNLKVDLEGYGCDGELKTSVTGLDLDYTITFDKPSEVVNCQADVCIKIQGSSAESSCLSYTHTLIGTSSNTSDTTLSNFHLDKSVMNRVIHTKDRSPRIYWFNSVNNIVRAKIEGPSSNDQDWTVLSRRGMFLELDRNLWVGGRTNMQLTVQLVSRNNRNTILGSDSFEWEYRPGQIRIFESTAQSINFRVPNGCESLMAYVWGAGGGASTNQSDRSIVTGNGGKGGDGGFLMAELLTRDFPEGSLLRLFVGEGGSGHLNSTPPLGITNTTIPGGFFSAGSCTVFNKQNSPINTIECGSGGGLSGIRIINNRDSRDIVLIAGGGGGGSIASDGGDGGGYISNISGTNQITYAGKNGRVLRGSVECLEGEGAQNLENTIPKGGASSSDCSYNEQRYRSKNTVYPGNDGDAFLGGSGNRLESMISVSDFEAPIEFIPGGGGGSGFRGGGAGASVGIKNEHSNNTIRHGGGGGGGSAYAAQDKYIKNNTLKSNNDKLGEARKFIDNPNISIGGTPGTSSEDKKGGDGLIILVCAENNSVLNDIMAQGKNWSP